MPDHPDIPLRVEAASFQGKAVYFQLIYPWTRPDAADYETYSTRDWAGLLIFSGVLIAILIVAVLLAWRNVRYGSGDRKGAFKLSLVILAAAFAGYFLSMPHVPAFFPELTRATHALRESLRIAVITWVIYLALEPIVRRNLPDLLVSWNRLMAGDWNDPLIGRDILFGTLFGLGHFSLIFLGKLAERLLNGDNSPLAFDVNPSLSGLRYSLAADLYSSSGGILLGFMVVCLMVIFYSLLRRRLYAAAGIFSLLLLIQVLFFTRSLVYLPFTITVSVLLTWLISRLGLVATMTSLAVFSWLQHTLFTTDLSAWYAGNMLLTISLILVLLAYGLKVSVANRRLFGVG